MVYFFFFSVLPARLLSLQLLLINKIGYSFKCNKRMNNGEMIMSIIIKCCAQYLRKLLKLFITYPSYYSLYKIIFMNIHKRSLAIYEFINIIEDNTFTSIITKVKQLKLISIGIVK